MNIYFFCEIDENKEPRFYNEFEMQIKASDGNSLFIISPEYKIKKDIKETKNLYMLPEEIFADFEKNLTTLENRDTLLSICRLPELEEYLIKIMKEYPKEEKFLHANGIYSSFNFLQENQFCINYVLTSRVQQNIEYVKFYQERMSELNKKNKELESHIAFVKECLQVRELQLLTAENRKTELEEILKESDFDGLTEQIRKFENEAQTYYEMYMNAVKEINILKEEKLSALKGNFKEKKRNEA